MESEPIIAGPTVALYPFTEGCITPEYLGWLADRELLRWSRQRHRQHDRASCLAYLRSFEGGPNHFWSVRRVNTEEPVGTMTAFVVPEDGVADVGILIGRPGRGIGREAWGLALAWLFERRSMRKVSAGTVAGHTAMRRIFEHWGMKLEGVRRAHQLMDGQPVDLVYYGLLASEWGGGARPD